MDPGVTETYMGEWKNDKRTGFGVSERSDGLKYEGEWYCNKKYGYGVTTFSNGEKEEGKYKNNVLITSKKKKPLFMMRSATFRERIDSAVNAAQRASKIALQKADIAISRTATARGKAEQADFSAAHARSDSDVAQEVANQYAPDFKQPGLEKLKALKEKFRYVDALYKQKDPTISANIPNQIPRQNTNDMSSPMSNQIPKSILSQPSQMSHLNPHQNPQLSNQKPNQMPNQMFNQMPNKMSNQMPNQMSNQMANQMPKQMPNQIPNQMSNQMYNQMSNQIPNQMSNQSPHQLSNQIPNKNPPFSNQLPNQQSQYNQMPNQKLNQLNKSTMNPPNQMIYNQTESYQLSSSNPNPTSNPPKTVTIPNEFHKEENDKPISETTVPRLGRNSIVGEEPNMNSLRRGSRRVSGDRPYLGSAGSQQSSIDHFDHYKRPPSRDSSVDRYLRATGRLSAGGSRQPSVDRAPGPSETPDRNTRAPSAVRGITPIPAPSKNGSVMTGNPMKPNNPIIPPFEDIIIRKRGLGQDIIPSPNQPKRTESLYAPGAAIPAVKVSRKTFFFQG